MGNKPWSTLGPQVYHNMTVPAGSSGTVSTSEEKLGGKAVGSQPILVEKRVNLPPVWCPVVCGPGLPASH